MSLTVLSDHAAKTPPSGLARKPPGCAACRYHHIGIGFCPDWYGARAKIAMLLEGPGTEEVLAHEPLVGKAGQFWLRELIHPLGYEREDIIISNTLRCKPPDNAYPTGELRAAAERHCRQYDNVHGSGGFERRKVVGVNHVAFNKGGLVSFAPDCFYITYHPAAILRQITLLRQVRRDLERAFAATEQGRRPVVCMGQKAAGIVWPHVHNGGLKKWRGHYGSLPHGWPYKSEVALV